MRISVRPVVGVSHQDFPAVSARPILEGLRCEAGGLDFLRQDNFLSGPTDVALTVTISRGTCSPGFGGGGGRSWARVRGAVSRAVGPSRGLSRWLHRGCCGSGPEPVLEPECKTGSRERPSRVRLSTCTLAPTVANANEPNRSSPVPLDPAWSRGVQTTGAVVGVPHAAASKSSSLAEASGSSMPGPGVCASPILTASSQKVVSRRPEPLA